MALLGVARVLDGVRTPMLRFAFAHSDFLRHVARSRGRRVELIALASIAFTLTLTLAFPVLVFLWAPLVLGVPHLVADLRYLVLSPYAPTVWRLRDLVIAIPLALTIWSPSPVIGGVAVLAALVLTPWSKAAPAQLLVRTSVLVIAIGVYFLVWQDPITASYFVLHGHNVVAIGFFAVVFCRGRRRVQRTVIGAAAVGSFVIMSGIADPLLRGGTVDAIAYYVLPDSAFNAWGELVCARIAVLFVFLQGVHYLVWLRLVPEMARPRKGMRSFVASLRALQVDFTSLGILLAVAAGLGILIYGMSNTFAARNLYLTFAGFHAYLELACLARWLSLPRSPVA